MDTILSGLTNLGLPGLCIGAVVALLWFMQTKLLPAMATAFLKAIKDERGEPRQYRVLLNQDIWGQVGGVESSHKLVQSFVIAEIQSSNGILDQLTVDHGPVPHPGRGDADPVNGKPVCPQDPAASLSYPAQVSDAKAEVHS